MMERLLAWPEVALLVFRILASLFLLAAVADASVANAASKPPRVVREVKLETEHGPMTSRYLSIARSLVGEPFTDPAIWALQRRYGREDTVSWVVVDRVGDTALVRLGEKPDLDFNFVPLPLVSRVSGWAAFEHWRLGGVYQSADLALGYHWEDFAVFDPRSQTPPLNLRHEYFNAAARWGVLIAPYTRLFLAADTSRLAMTADPAQLYRDAQTSGWVTTVGPALRLDTTDDEDYPREGTRVGASAAFGPQALGNRDEYATYTAAIQQYWPFGVTQGVVLALDGGWGNGNLPWIKRFPIGGATILRSHRSNRFLGTRMLAATLELRSRLGEWRLPMVGLPIGFAGGIFGIAGRSWETDLGPAFGEDLRGGGGLWLGVGGERSIGGRLELGYGDEGPVVNLGVGLPLGW